MDKFTASNGVTVWRDKRGSTLTSNWATSDAVDNYDSDALREFFQAERDEELGLWRSKSHPGWTAVRRHTVVYFQHEDHERSFHVVIGNKTSLNSWSWDLVEVAREYLEAHPEPKPWHSAKPGEVWVLTVPAGERPAVVRHDGAMYDEEGNEYAMTRVTAARRIFPESD